MQPFLKGLGQHSRHPASREGQFCLLFVFPSNQRIYQAIISYRSSGAGRHSPDGTNPFPSSGLGVQHPAGDPNKAAYTPVLRQDGQPGRQAGPVAQQVPRPPGVNRAAWAPTPAQIPAVDRPAGGKLGAARLCNKGVALCPQAAATFTLQSRRKLVLLVALLLAVRSSLPVWQCSASLPPADVSRGRAEAYCPIPLPSASRPWPHCRRSTRAGAGCAREHLCQGPQSTFWSWTPAALAHGSMPTPGSPGRRRASCPAWRRYRPAPQPPRSPAGVQLGSQVVAASSSLHETQLPWQPHMQSGAINQHLSGLAVLIAVLHPLPPLLSQSDACQACLPACGD